MSRRKGWRKPVNTVYVGRPGRFGNPFRVEDYGREQAIRRYAAWIQESEQAVLLDEAKRTLRGKTLGCWCRPGLSCHAGVLVRMVNEC